MSGDLSTLQARLSEHYEALRQARGRTTEQPLFALEHGLDTSEILALTSAVRQHVQHSAPSRDHSLVWIVYAAEIGYRYAGDEYWQTFEEETPGWTAHGSRAWIRDAYHGFQNKYGGAKPSGAWAQHFSIICWPITHAILPKDLQRQLARILYELRHAFSAELFESPTELGELIGAHSWSATSRFRNFAQETNLVGQIAAALLLQGEFGTNNLIHSATLRRISEDLDQERRAREWLRDARRFAEERARIRGLGPGRGITSFATRRVEEAREEVVALGIEPRLTLRPMNTAASSWDVQLEIPDLSHLLVRFPRFHPILTGSRCVVSGAAGRPLARGRCLHGSQRVSLARWPGTGDVLLQFEQKDPQLDFLLRSECLLRPGPMWLFRIASDGIAYEMRSLRVRPGERYIIINADGPVGLPDRIHRIDLGCQGIYGAIMELPQSLTADWEETLRSLQLRQAKTIEVWPAGLSAVVWDGEGHGEWLSSERPCLAVCTDHSVDGLAVEIGTGAGQQLQLTPVVPGRPVFVELPELPVGLHNVRFSALGTSTNGNEPLGELNVVIRIRKARPWAPGLSAHGPLLFNVVPPAPSLEQFWEGRIEVSLEGPLGRQAKCSVSFFDRDDQPATFSTHLPQIDMPVTSDGWRSHIEKHLRSANGAAAAYDCARSCEVVITAEELGACTFRFEREFVPLRWSVRRGRHGYDVRLLNDSGDVSGPVITYSAFETPCVNESLPAQDSYHVPNAGGLYLARLDDFRAAVIAPPLVSGLSDLCCSPTIHDVPRSAQAVISAIKCAGRWGEARLPGDLISTKRQRDVLNALVRHIVSLIGGSNWSRAELVALGGNDDTLRILQDAITRRSDEIALGVVLGRDAAQLATIPCDARVAHIAPIADRYLILSPRTEPASVIATNNTSDDHDPAHARWLTEFALRLVSDPANVEQWAAAHLQMGVTRLMEEAPTLVRAARFVVLFIDRHLHSDVAPAELYAGWRWT